MTTHSNTAHVHTEEECTYPVVGALLPDYIVDLLEDSVAEKVERHLVDCRHCKERYVTVLRVRESARRKRIGSAESDDDAIVDDEEGPGEVDIEKRWA